ncbi:galactosyltransferase-related protein [Rossellomorea aquimaris]|uniref:Glycosyl transferase family 2 n=1 Tax=Rossellomorea aquimaris TaxID=189382 RepID=A0A366EWG5_9BACI|nr:galactosyltransferase-related protein [Rossellomorea aquimaris]RBP06733.1 glycosyl transferase family 2 [Rossellomorea aquimaris]
MITFSIIIPFQSKDPYRIKALQVVMNYYKTLFPNTDIIIASNGSDHYSKSSAINKAVKKTNTEYIAIIDADILCPKNTMLSGLKLLESFPLILPYNNVCDLYRHMSEVLYDKPNYSLSTSMLHGKNRHNKKSVPVGGINLIKKTCFIKIKGFDERFIGWGGEDDAFVAACDTICGPHKRLTGDIYHLWHPPKKAKTNPFYSNNHRIVSEYFLAYYKKEEMMKILSKRKGI